MEFVLDRDHVEIQGDAGPEEYTQFRCPYREHCGFTFLVLHDWCEDKKGKSVRCPRCNRPSELPAVAAK